MLEIEMKFPVAEFAPIQERLQRLRARADEAVEEAEHYFNAPDRDFARTDEAFRLRRVGESNILTYKGTKMPGVAKSRVEIEVPLADGSTPAEKLELLVKCLGYRPVAIVRKRRRIY